MKIIKNMVEIKLLNGNVLFINNLNGLMDEIDSINYSIFCKWKDSEYINDECFNIEEKSLYYSLMNRGYLVENSEKELNIRQSLEDSLQEKHDKMKNIITTACFIPSYNCNFACPYCYEVKEKAKAHNPKITIEMVDNAFNIMSETVNRITFYGGEPLLLENIDIIKYIISKKPTASFSAITNGYYLKEYLSIFKSINVDYIQVTLDGFNETHNKKRILKDGQATYEKIIQGIRLYLENSIPIKIRMNMDETNFQECIDLREYLLQEFFDFIDYIFFELSVLNDLNEKVKYRLLSHLYKNDLLDNRIVNGEMPIEKFNTILTSPVPAVNFILKGDRIFPVFSGCDMHLGRRFFDPDGYMYNCILKIGNKDKSIARYHPEYTPFNNTMFDRVVTKIDKCSKCNLAFMCGGGCPMGVGDNDIMQPNCAYNKNEIYSMLPIIYDITHRVTDLRAK